jgi:putative DNA primase/helicase
MIAVKSLPFEYTIPENERIPNFREACLYPELSGILNWCIEGSRQWQRKGLRPPESVKHATTTFIHETNHFQRFIDDCCIFESGREIGATFLYRCFKKYCEKEIGLPENRIEKQTAFGRYLTMELKLEKANRPQVVYFGIDIKKEWEKRLLNETL